MPVPASGLTPTAAAAAVASASASAHSLLTVSPQASDADVLRASLRTYPPARAPPTVVTIDLSDLAANVALFRALLPTVTPHYAIKCLPDRAVLSALASLGVAFDIASPVELHLALAALRADNHPSPSSALIYANPIKAPAHLRAAAAAGVDLVTLDSPAELEKLREHHPRARALLRLATDDATSAIPLSTKFGAAMPDVDDILRAAARLGVALVGVAFHVGSGAASPLPYRTAMRDARRVFDRAEHFGHSMTVLDIGGGFPAASDRPAFEAIASAVKSELQSFPASTSVIAEPGRFLVASTVNIATRVLRASHRPGARSRYAIGDGVYGVFRDARISDEIFVPQVLLRNGHNASPSPAAADDERSSGRETDGDTTTECDLHGPTDEPFDVVATAARLPQLQPGDWVWFQRIGAYTLSLRTRRSDIEKPAVFYVFRSAADSVGSQNTVDLRVGQESH